MDWDRWGQLKPRGAGTSGADASFAAICPFSPGAADEDAIAATRFPAAAHVAATVGRYEACYVGHVEEAPFRSEGSSGGMVTWVAAELLKRGEIDGIAHVAPVEGRAPDQAFFRYRLSRSVDELRGGAKSRYYPVEMSQVLDEIRAVPGRYAVVGIPCFIKAVNLMRLADPVIGERVTHTLGLFCGHMKSARLVESFAWQLHAVIDDVAAVDYRLKDAGRPANWYRAQLTLRDGAGRGEDWWHLADGDWGAGFFANSACDMCDDVVAETADVSFGDAWVEPYSSDGRGTNVVVVRSPGLARMIADAQAAGRLALTAVDDAFVADTQAAGFRHRREGLAYRLTWDRRSVRPRKRVAADGIRLPWRRRLVYRCRWAISRLSHRLFHLARALRCPPLYLAWARLSLRLYQALTYSRGPLGRMFDRLERRR